MERSRLRSCCIIGAGNVATHLAAALAPHLKILQVFSRKIDNASALAERVDAEAICNLSDLLPDADLYLISVTDDQIKTVLDSTSHISDGIWAHTSGSVGMNIFEGMKSRFGVFYPLQTFSKNKAVEMSEVPFMIEGSSKGVEDALVAMAQTISNDVIRCGSETRAKLHVAAVFACNFTNFMLMQADEILRDNGLDLSVFRPLLRETMDKLATLTPEQGQTGPARRGDTEIISRHLSMLDDDKAEIYKLLSEKILNKFNPK